MSILILTHPILHDLGTAIIASPFPDELGIALLGITKLETKRFLVLSFILNTIGTLVIVGVGKIF